MRFSPCVLIPTYHNPRTLEQVVRAARAHAPVIVVDDGSTDATPAMLGRLGEELSDVTVLTHPRNRGKGAALRTGMDHAHGLGFTHAISMDSDGQHLAEDLPAFLRAATERPDTLFLGNRDLPAAGARIGSRLGCSVSNFWTWAETGHRLPDTQTGFRCYPLGPISRLHVGSTGYEFEVEVLVRAAWVGIPIDSLPIRVIYFSGAQRVSHMRPIVDFLRISHVNTKLCILRTWLPLPYLGLVSQRRFHALSLRERIAESFVELFVREPGSPRRVAGSVALGLFMGIAPFWGFQIALTLLLAPALGASKVVAVTASNISFPVMIVPIVYASLVLGRLVTGADDVGVDWASPIPRGADLWPYVAGSFLLASIVAVVGALLTLVLAKRYERRRRRRQQTT